MFVAALLAWRARRLRRGRSVTRVADRAVVAVALAWLGVPIGLLPAKRAQRDAVDQIRSVAGADVLHGLRWSAAGIPLTVIVALGVALLMFRGATPTSLPPVPAQLRWAASSSAVAYLVLLVGMLVT